MQVEVLRELSRPRLSLWLRAVVFDWAVIVGAMTITYFALQSEHWLRWPVVFAAVVLIGVRQHGLGLMGHDGAHRLVCRNRFVNDALTGLLCFWPMGSALNGYRVFHFKHHRTVGTPDDPETIHTKHRWLGQWNLPLRLFRLFGQVLTDFFGGSLPHLGMAARLTNAVSLLDRLGPVATLTVCVGVCWWLDALWIPVVWFGSLVTSFWVVFRLRIWTEHIVEDGKGDPTRRISATWWQRFLLQPHNTWCHWEHHLYPQVPSCNLPTVRELTLDVGPPVVPLGQLVRTLKTPAASVSSRETPPSV